MSTYEQILAAIYARVDYSRSRQAPYNADTYNLERMRDLCTRLGDPQDCYPSVHIAGSKGKGSTAAMTMAMLQACGFHTGLYTSPHLHTFRERIRRDGDLISKARLGQLWEQARPVIEAVDTATTFEIITALAFLDFAQPPVDWAVVEVGLGGRLDATNIIHPRACAITSLSHEHTDLLGDTLSLIASEKAGIIKPGASVVVGPQAPEAMNVIAEAAARAGAPLWRVGVDWRWELHYADDKGLRLDIHGPDVSLYDLWVPLAGYHQAANATIAVALVYALAPHGVHPSPDHIRRGLADAYWPGRLECLSHRPLLVLDGAHNRTSAENLYNALSLFPHQRLILIFGASADKDIRGMLEVLAPAARAIIVTRCNHPRAADPIELSKLVESVAPTAPLYITANTRQALDQASVLAKAEDLILVTGSIFTVASIRDDWFHLHPHYFISDDWVHFSEPIDGAFTPMLPEPLSTTRPLPADSV